MVRFGIIGTNWITDRFIEAAKGIDDFMLTAVYSRTEEKAVEFGSKYNIPNTYTNIEEMVLSDEVDAVYIASPNSFHKEQAILCMKKGKHVLCEKPMASNASEVKEMIAVAQENNVVLMEALKTTLLPNFQAIKDNLYKVGKVRKYVASYCQYSSRYDAYKEGTVLNAFKPEFSNGALMDIGVYCIYPLVTLFGKPTSLQATGMRLESGVDGQGSILFTYEEMDAVVVYSKIANSYLPTEIQGEDGSILIDKIHTPEKVEIHYKDGTVEDITVSQEAPSMFYEAKEFIELVKTREPKESFYNSFENSLVTAEIMEEARKQMGIIYPADKN